MPLTSLSDVKAALGVSGSGEDARLTLLMAAAEATIARATGLMFTVGAVTEDHAGGVATLALRARPVVSITSVTDLASGTVLAAGDYALDTRLGLLRRMPYGFAWEGARAPGPFLDPLGDGPGAVRPRWRVVFQAGYATAPADLQGAAFEMIAAARGMQGGLASVKDGDFAASYAPAMGGIPAAAQAVIDAYRVVM